MNVYAYTNEGIHAEARRWLWIPGAVLAEGCKNPGWCAGNPTPVLRHSSPLPRPLRDISLAPISILVCVCVILDMFVLLIV